MNKIRVKRPTKKRAKKLTSRQQRALPILFLLLDIEDLTPEEVMSKLIYITSPKSKELLDEFKKQRLVEYLDKQGYDTAWLSA